MQKDKMTINGTEYTAELDVAEKGGNPAAIHGGRILYYLLSCEGVAMSLFEDGEWKIPLPASEEEACVAQIYFITKWSKEPSEREKIGGEADVEGN